MAVAGLAEMDLGVHHPRQHMQAFGLEHGGGLGIREGTNGGDTPRENPGVGEGNAVRGGDGSAPDQQIKTFLHGERQLAQPPGLGNHGGYP